MAETNPHRILKRLDQNLAQPVELTLFGRAALALGFGEALPEWGQTLDVDLIVAAHPAARLEADNPFWDALEATNAQLAPSGLFLAHILEEHQLILRPGWYAQRRRIEWPELGKLTLYRPATLDLILTKMARADDPEDRRDILTMMALDRLSPQAVRQAMARGRRLGTGGRLNAAPAPDFMRGQQVLDQTAFAAPGTAAKPTFSAAVRTVTRSARSASAVPRAKNPPSLAVGSVEML